MRLKMVVCTVLMHSLFLTASPIKAEEVVPKAVAAGFALYKTDGPEKALKAWIKDGPFDGRKEALAPAEILTQIETFYGGYKGYQLLHSVSVGETVRLLYMLLNFEKGPGFACFTVYKTEKDWVVSNLDFNIKAEILLPESVLSKRRQ